MQSIRDALDKLNEEHGPFEVVLVTAPEPFEAGSGIQRVPSDSEITFALSSLQEGRIPDETGLSHIGEINLVMNRQVATALHSFLTVLLEQVPSPRRPGSVLLPMARFNPESAEDQRP